MNESSALENIDPLSTCITRPARKDEISVLEKDDTLKRWRSKLVPYFAAVVMVALLMILAYLWIIFRVVMNLPNYVKSTTDVVVLATLFHVGLGMIMGLAAISFGVVMSWVGIEAPFALQTGTENAAPAGNLKLQSVGPGIVLLIGGMAITYFSLYLPIEIEPHQIIINKGDGKPSRVEAEGVIWKPSTDQGKL